MNEYELSGSKSNFPSLNVKQQRELYIVVTIYTKRAKRNVYIFVLLFKKILNDDRKDRINLL